MTDLKTIAAGATTTSGTAFSGTVLPPADLAVLAKQINDNHRDIVNNAKSMLTKAIAAGEALVAAKAALPHGEFAKWIADNCDVMPRTVQDYMRIAAHRKQIEQWLRENANGSIAGALKLIRQSPDLKPEPTIIEDEIVMSVIKKVQTVLGKEHQRAVVVAARIVERLKDMRLVD